MENRASRRLVAAAAIAILGTAHNSAAFGRLDSDGEVPRMNETAQGESPAQPLPYARGKTFDTLDEYLAHLRANGAIDLPWYREARPGVYELVTSIRPPGPPEYFTREELMERFGFSR